MLDELAGSCFGVNRHIWRSLLTRRLATALLRYKRAKDEHGLEALLLGRVDAAALESDGPLERRRSDSRRSYKVKCPNCGVGHLVAEEGCEKCYSCGYSKC